MAGAGAGISGPAPWRWPLGDGDQDFGGAVDGGLPAAFTDILLGVGLAALGFGAAGEAKTGIIEAGQFAFDRLADTLGSDRRVNGREVMAAQLGARRDRGDG